MTEAGDSAAIRRGAGCLATGALFIVSFILAWITAITTYGLVIEQWQMIRVRRDFSYDWVFLYAPLFAIGIGAAVAFWATRRLPVARLTLLIVLTGLVALLGAVALFGFGGVISDGMG